MNATSYSNIGWLKTAIEKEWNEISEKFILMTYQFILKTCKCVLILLLKKWLTY